MGEARRPWWRSVVASLIGGLLGSALVVLAGFGHWLVAAGLLVAVVLAETWWYWVGIPWAIARRARRAHRHCAYERANGRVLVVNESLLADLAAREVRALGERDRARATAVALEAELADLSDIEPDSIDSEYF
jgi:hypothetical protein